MNKYYFFATTIVICSQVQAQQFDLNQLEANFLQQNAQLIAQHLQIDEAEAKIVQEKFWHNPTLSISEVNLWKTTHIETLPALIGNYGQTQQLSIELEQLIETAGKRKKRVALKELEKIDAQLEYENVLRELKKELHLNYHQLNRLKQENEILQTLLNLYQQLSHQYKNQSDKLNIPKAEYHRIQTELIGLNHQSILLQKEINQALNQIKILTHLPNLELEQISFNPISYQLSERIPMDWKNQLKEQNLLLKRQNNSIEKAKQQLIIEKANRTPDLALQLNYDRGGNIMRDFIGVGISLDLPLFNTNKGNIKAAQTKIEQENQLYNAITYSSEIQIHQLIDQLKALEDSLNQWNMYQNEERATILFNYKKNLEHKQVTLLEFIDFTQAYYSAIQTYIELEENYLITWEEIQQLTGKDL